MVRRWTLRKNLITVNVVLLVVGILFSSVMLLRYSVNVTMKNLLNSSYDMLDYAGRNIDDFINSEIKISTEMIQNDLQLKEVLNAKIVDYEDDREKFVDVYMINRYLLQRNSYLGISSSLSGMVNRYGVVYNLQYPMNYDKTAAEYVQELQQTEPKTMYEYSWYSLRENCFAPKTKDIRKDLAIPVKKNLLFDGGGNQGALIFMLKEQDIYTQYKDCGLLKNGYMYIIDNQGNLVSHSDEQFLSEDKSPRYIKEILNETEDYFIDKNQVIMSKKVNDGNWYMVAVIPLNDMLTELFHTYKYFILVIVGILFISILISAILSKEVVKPVEKMIKSMEYVENGHFSVRVEEKGPSDIVQLLHYYNNMLKNTEDYIHKEYQIKKMKRAAELDVLVAQINPHFLYNTLESIVWQARAAGAPKISDMAYSLGKLFNIMVNKGHSMLSVERELEHVKLYVHLQNIRYNNRFSLKIDLDDEDLLEYKTLKLILQPIIENVILHGFPEEQEECIIHIGVYESHKMLIYEVEDNGVGISKEELAHIRESFSEQNYIEYDEQNAKARQNKGRGIGLKNVHQRIQLYYGMQFGLEIKSIEGEGTEVIVKIPMDKS